MKTYPSLSHPAPASSPFGIPYASRLVFPEIPVWLVLGPMPYGYPRWSLFMVREDFAYSELTPITLAYAGNCRGRFDDNEGTGWFCFEDTTEAAMLAWDYHPFMELVSWAPGIAALNEQSTELWIEARRNWTQDILQDKRPDYLFDFFGQYEGGSHDDR